MPYNAFSIHDDALRAAQTALDGLALRQEIIGRNLANVDTPGYQAQSVDFESALRRAQGSGGELALRGSQPAHLASPESMTGSRVTPRLGGSERADGNNVDIDTELIEMTETGVRFQALSQLVSSKLALLKTIASGR